MRSPSFAISILAVVTAGFGAARDAELAIEYASFFGGDSSARINAIAADREGNLYLAGDVRERDLPTVNSLQPRGVIFAAKVERATNRIVYATYLGSDGTDESARSIAVDHAGNAYITGWTNSTAFPVVNAFDPRLKWGLGPHIDGFILKLNPTGSRIVYSSYLGGNFDDRGYAVGVDAKGAAYVAGLAQSRDFPVTPGAYLTEWPGQTSGFVTKIKPDGSGIEYSTFVDFIASRLAVDAVGNVALLAGEVIRLDSSGALSSRYRFERGINPSAIALDAAGNAWVSGIARSYRVPVTSGALQQRHSNESYYRGEEGGQALTPGAEGLTGVDWVTSFAVDPSSPSVMYAASPQGVFQSTDNGHSWHSINSSGLEGYTVTRIVVDPRRPDTLYALAFGASPPALLFKSVDGGALLVLHQRWLG